MYEGFRVPQDSARAVGPEVSQGSTKLCKDSTHVPQGPTMLHQGCVVRPWSEKQSDQDRFAHGRNTKHNRNQWFLAHFHCFVTCSLARANVGFVANQITSLRNSRCSRVNAWHCCLVGFGFQRIPRGCEVYEVRRFPPNSAKAMGQPGVPAKFHAKLHESCVRTVCEVHRAQVRARLHCRIAPFGPDRPRLRHRAPIKAQLSPAPSIVPSWHRLVLL